MTTKAAAKPPKTDLVLCLAATKMTQGQRSNDFFHADEGEAVYIGMTCDGATTDDRCGCARSFSGVKTYKATTTARIDLRPRAALISDRAAYYVRAWKMTLADARDAAIDDVQNMAVNLRAFERHDVIELRDDCLQRRRFS